MPGGDGTGPLGLGPMTGRAAGYCAGYAMPGYATPISGLGLGGWSRRGGRRRAPWFPASAYVGWPRGGFAWPISQWPSVGLTHQQEIDALKGQLQYFENILEDLRRRIGTLKPKATSV